MSAPRSETLFHFTKSLDILKLILANGFAPRFCLEDASWMDFSEKHLAYAMCCFCDIPLSRITDHTKFYGQFGLGLSKEWGLKNGLNPVLYFPGGGHLPKFGNFLLRLDATKLAASKKSELDSHSFQLLKLMKPIRGTMVVSGKLVEKDFYQENEWRYTPTLDSVIYKSAFDEMREQANKDAEAYALRVTPADIKYIFVPNDSDIPALADFIHNNMGNFPHSDIKILQTRIVSLRTIEADM